LLPFAPGAGRADEKPDIPRRKEIAKQNACLSKKLLRFMICSVGKRDNRFSQQVERRIGMMVYHSRVRHMHSPPLRHFSLAAGTRYHTSPLAMLFCDAI